MPPTYVGVKFGGGVEEEGTNLGSGLFDEVDAPVEFAQLVMASARVGEDLYSVEAHQDMRAGRHRYFVNICIRRDLPGGGEELLT